MFTASIYICRFPVQQTLMQPRTVTYDSFVPFADNGLNGLFDLWHVKPGINFPKSSWKVNSSEHKTCVHCLLVHLRWTNHSSVSVQSWHMASSLHNTILDAVTNNILLALFSMVALLFLVQCRMRVRGSCESNCGFCPLLRRFSQCNAL